MYIYIHIRIYKSLSPLVLTLCDPVPTYLHVFLRGSKNLIDSPNTPWASEWMKQKLLQP